MVKRIQRRLLAVDGAAVSRLLDSEQVTGTVVNPPGSSRKLVAGAAGAQLGAIGRAAAEIGAGRSSRTPARTPRFERVAYLAVGADEVALVALAQGAFKLKLTGEVLARVPRSEVASAQLGKGRLAHPLTISFDDGGSWRFDVPRALERPGRQVADALAA